jgi:multisubunit Na+/H+ antiporter MnhB subunit
MKKFIGVIAGFTLAFAVAFAFNVPEAFAQGAVQQGVQAAQGEGVPTTLLGDTGIITTIINVLLFIAGALAVIMLIFGGLRYTVSGGNSSAVTAAKNTILYAIVGLIIAFLAFAAVNWVLGVITPGSGGATGFSNR